MAIRWGRAVPLAFHLCCFNFSAVLVVRVPVPFGVWGRMWNSIVSFPDHCLFIFFDCNTSLLLKNPLFPSKKPVLCSPSAQNLLEDIHLFAVHYSVTLWCKGTISIFSRTFPLLWCIVRQYEGECLICTTDDPR